MQQTPRYSEGCRGILVTRKESFESQDTTPNHEYPDDPPQKPLRVTQEAVDAYERRTGFYGIGKIMVEDGHWIIVTRAEREKPKAPDHTNHLIISRQRGLA